MLKLALAGTSPKFHLAMSLRETLQFVRSVGLSNFEIVDPNCDLLPGEERAFGRWSQIDVPKAKQTLEEEGCRAPIVQFRFGMNTKYNSNVEMHVEEFKAAIDAAVAFNSEVILHYLPFSVFQDLDMGLVHAYLDEPLRYAKTKGLVLALENEFENPATQSPEKMLKIMQEFDDPAFLTNYDAPNYQVHNDEGYPYAYNLLKDYIGYVHLKNVCRYREGYHDKGYIFGEDEREELLLYTSGPYNGEPAAFVPVFEGEVNTFGLLTRLMEDDYQGYVTFEPHATVPLAIRDIKSDLVLLRKYGFVE